MTAEIKNVNLVRFGSTISEHFAQKNSKQKFGYSTYMTNVMAFKKAPINMISTGGNESKEVFI